mmetsp:Transcript_9027/g.15004  ORF Transcript_9027/g.15004 Transcript_9027/m.15004 type:complete len:87 (-) Transcript_9027:68-328(-)
MLRFVLEMQRVGQRVGQLNDRRHDITIDHVQHFASLSIRNSGGRLPQSCDISSLLYALYIERARLLRGLNPSRDFPKMTFYIKPVK